MGFNFEEYAKQNTLMLNNMNKMILDIEDKAVNQVGKEIDKLKSVVEILANDNKLTKNELDTVKNDLSEQKEINKKITKMTYVLKNDTDGKLIKLKNKCKSRIKLLVGKDKSGYKYILFYNCYISSIYGTIKKALGNVNTIGDISIDSFDTAIGIATVWQPDDYTINKRVKELLSMRDKNKLSVAQEKSLDEYLEEKLGGKSA